MMNGIFRNPSATQWVIAAVAFLFLAATDRAVAQGDFEPAPTLQAGEILGEKAAGDRYRVAQDVANDGYMNFYRIESDFGPFEAYGNTQLAVRLHEIGALAELDELSKTKVFVDAVGKAALSQVDAVKDLATKPVATVKGVPGGVKRMFKRVKRDVDEGVETVKKLSDDDEEAGGGGEGEKDDSGLVKEGAEAGTKYAKKYFGATRAERLWAQKLGVDPYTSNEVLLAEIRKVAKVDAAGGFTVRLAPVPRIPGVSAVQDLNDLVWSMDPRELRERNVKTLTEAGVAPEMVEKLFESPWYSPTLQTYLIAALVEMKTVAGLEVAVERATEVESPEEALFLVDGVRMLAAFHADSAQVERLVGGAALPAALTQDRRLIFQVPSGHLSWTEGIAAAADGPFGKAGSDLDIASRELWFRGGVSERCRTELEQRGWVVQTNAESPAGNRDAG